MPQGQERVESPRQPKRPREGSESDVRPKNRVRVDNAYNQVLGRLKDGRASATDWLAAPLLLPRSDDGNGRFVEGSVYSPGKIINPVDIIRNASADQAVTLLPQLKALAKVDYEERYWESVVLLCEKRAEGQFGETRQSDPVLEEAEALVAGQTVDELHDLQDQVEDKLRQLDKGRDFWEKLQERISIALAEKSILKVFYDALGVSSSDPLPSDLVDDDSKAWVHAKSGSDNEQANSSDDDNDETLAAEDSPADPHLKRPRYISRVIRGFNWTPYNRAHYNRENLPPKHITGYRFRVLYPLLKGTGRVPKFKVVYDDADRQGAMCTLVFRAGEPYQDLRFRIVNRPWDRSLNQRGSKRFICEFADGALDLQFRFKPIFSK